MKYTLEKVLGMDLEKRSRLIYKQLKQYYPEMTRNHAKYIAPNDGFLEVLVKENIPKSQIDFPGEDNSYHNKKVYREKIEKYLKQWFDFPHVGWSTPIMKILSKYCRDKSEGNIK